MFMVNTDRKPIPEERGIKHYVDILSLTSAADSGCELCKLILEELFCRFGDGDRYGEEPLGVAFCLILEPTGNSNEYVRRGVAEVPDVYGMVDEGWETRIINIV
jgi:hypothetical protein